MSLVRQIDPRGLVIITLQGFVQECEVISQPFTGLWFQSSEFRVQSSGKGVPINLGVPAPCAREAPWFRELLRMIGGKAMSVQRTEERGRGSVEAARGTTLVSSARLMKNIESEIRSGLNTEH